MPIAVPAITRYRTCGALPSRPRLLSPLALAPRGERILVYNVGMELAEQVKVVFFDAQRASIKEVRIGELPGVVDLKTGKISLEPPARTPSVRVSPRPGTQEINRFNNELAWPAAK